MVKLLRGSIGDSAGCTCFFDHHRVTDARLVDRDDDRRGSRRQPDFYFAAGGNRLVRSDVGSKIDERFRSREFTPQGQQTTFEFVALQE